MKSYRKELFFNAPERMHFINITPEIKTCLDESAVEEGFVLVNAMHIWKVTAVNQLIGELITRKDCKYKYTIK